MRLQWRRRGAPPPNILQTTSLRLLGTKFAIVVSLFSGKIVKIVATRSHLLKLKCTKFDFGWGSTTDPAGGAHSAPQTRSSGP